MTSMSLDHEGAIAVASYRRRRRRGRNATRERPRILQLLATGGAGGAQESAIALLVHLDRSAFEVEAVSLTDGAAIRRLRDLGIKATVLAPQDDASAVRELVAILEGREIDLLHAHMFRAELTGTRAARTAGTPVVVATVHSSRVRSSSDVAALAGVTPFIDRLIAPSGAIAAKVRREGRGAAEITVVPNGVGLDSFSPERRVHEITATRTSLGIPVDAFLIGVIARLEHEKGHRHLLDAMPAVVDLVPNAWLVLVGAGSQDDSLRAQAGSLPLRARQQIAFAGVRTDIAAITEALDVAVLPSGREAQGLAVLEAMAARRPVVATSVGGIPETIRDGTDGLLVPPADPGALAAAIVRLARSPRLRDRLAASGRRRVEERFSAAASVRRIEAIYAEELVRAGVLALPSIMDLSAVGT
jgi:glycosyltransferase involved in cell wall biosynthesis